MGQKTLYVKGVFLVIIRCVAVEGMLGEIIFVGQKRADAAKLQDALAAIQHGKLIHAHQLLAQFLIVQRMGNLAATALAGVIAVDGFLTQRRRQLFQRTGFLTAQKDGAVHVADDRIRAVFIQGFELALRLQDKAAGDFSGTDRRYQLLKPRYLADIRGLVDQAADMNRQASAVHIIRLFTQQVEKLGIAHGNEKVKGIIRIGHDDEQGGFPVAQRVQLQLVIGRQLPKLLNVKGRKPCAAGNKYAFRGLARDKLSRTF